MIDQPLVSVIIPTYNRAHLIGETLDSVLAQTYQHWECIIVDDGSSDDTDEVVGEYINKDPRFKYYHRPDEHLPGGNGARNYGFKMSQGEYIQWFDSDDLMLTDKLELCINEIYKDDFDIVITNFKYSGGKENKLDLNNFHHPLEYHLAYGFLNTVMVFFKKTFLKNTNFDESLTRAQELEFYTRLLDAKVNFTIVNKTTVTVRIHDNSISSIHKKQRLNEQNSSLLFGKLKSYEKSFQFDQKCQQLAKIRFMQSLLKILDYGEFILFLDFTYKYIEIRSASLSKFIPIIFLSLVYVIFGRMRILLKKNLFSL